MKSVLWSLLPLSLCCLSPVLNSPPAWAQSPTSTQVAAPQTDPVALLKAAAAYLAKQPAFTFTNEIVYDNVLSGGDKVQQHGSQTVYLQRPNRLRSDYEGDFRHTQVIYDGSKFTWLDLDQNLYFQASAPSSVDALVQELLARNDGGIPMINLVTSDPFAAYDPQRFQAQYLGISLVNGQPTHNLLFSSAEKNWQLFIRTTEPPLIEKIVITYKTLPGAPQYTSVFTEWSFPASQPSNLFTFTPPANAVAVPQRSDILNLSLPAGLNAPDGLTPPPLTPSSPGLNDPNLRPPR